VAAGGTACPRSSQGTGAGSCPVLCQNIVYGLNCCFTLGACARSPRLRNWQPGARETSCSSSAEPWQLPTTPRGTATRYSSSQALSRPAAATVAEHKGLAERRGQGLPSRADPDAQRLYASDSLIVDVAFPRYLLAARAEIDAEDIALLYRQLGFTTVDEGLDLVEQAYPGRAIPSKSPPRPDEPAPGVRPGGRSRRSAPGMTDPHSSMAQPNVGAVDSAMLNPESPEFRRIHRTLACARGTHDACLHRLGYGWGYRWFGVGICSCECHGSCPVTSDEPLTIVSRRAWRESCSCPGAVAGRVSRLSSQGRECCRAASGARALRVLCSGSACHRGDPG
jgi:hypothetical protein